MLKLTILKAGLQTTLQDLGRSGYQDKGVPSSGALDQLSYQLSNTLVNNELGTPVIEITLMGPQIEFSENCTIAITGANLSPCINGQSISMNRAIIIRSGDLLSFGRPISGARSYIAVAGDWDIPRWLGSSSPLLYTSHNGRTMGMLQKGDQIQISTKPLKASIELASEDHIAVKELEVMFGPDFDSFSPEAIAEFFAQDYVVSQDCNRMGYRLHGRAIDKTRLKQMISSGVVPGTVQIANDGLPIVIMRDGQTIGGYPRIANLTEYAINVLAQKKPGDGIRFVLSYQ